MIRRGVSLALACLAIVLVTGGCVAVESATSPGTGSEGCPCTVGNSGIHATLACGQSECITLNGQQTGYHCTQNGAVEDPAVCTSGRGGAANTGGAGQGGAANVGGNGQGSTAGFPAGGSAGSPACVPRTCAELPAACGAAPDGCGKTLNCPACAGGLVCSPASSCLMPAQNVIVIGNYQGGTFTLNIDQHLPALGIGLVSYQAMNVKITGAFASDVVAVSHAGYEKGTTVTGVAPQLFSDVHLPDPDGNPTHLIADDIPEMFSMDGSKGRIEGYFTKIFGGGKLAFHLCQYNAYTGDLSVSVGGNCP